MRPAVGRALATALDVWRRMGAHGVGDAAASLAYRFFLALFPFAIFVAALVAFVRALFQGSSAAQVPPDVLNDEVAELLAPVRDQLRAIMGRPQPALFSLGVIGSIWVASSGAGAVIRATNRAYQVKESRPYWKRCLLALGLTVFAGAALTGAFVLQVAGAAIADVLTRQGGPAAAYGAALATVRWPGAVVLLALAAAIVYRAAPNVELPWRWVSPGAAVFVAGWLLTTFGFSVYVTVFGDYSETYGALAGVAVLLIWFYLTAYVVLCGAELNAYLDRRSVEARATQPEGGVGRGASTAPAGRSGPAGPARSPTGAAGPVSPGDP